MPAVTIDLPPASLQRLQELADHLGVTLEVLVWASVEELLTRSDDAVQCALEYVLAKNAAIYRRKEPGREQSPVNAFVPPGRG